MKKGTVEWEFITKLILAAILLVILLGIYIMIKNKMYGDEGSILQSIKGLFIR